MIQQAVVVSRLENGMARVRVIRKGACGDNCAFCKAGCESKIVDTEVENPIGAREGDRVTLQSSSRQVLGLASLAYLLPFVLFFALYAAAGALNFPDWLRTVLGLAGFTGGFGIAALCARKSGKTPVIISIDNQGGGTCSDM